MRAQVTTGSLTYLFNGNFEFEPTPSPFDWNLGHAQGVEVTRDCSTAGPGNCSLRISFAGTQNLDFAAASQLAFVQPGPYRLHASIRTEGLTTDQGIRFRICDAELPARLDVIFGQFKGTMPWSPVEQDLVGSTTDQASPCPGHSATVDEIRQQSQWDCLD